MNQTDLFKGSDSPYVSPMICDPNPDEKLRVCVSLRIVNKDNVDDAYPMHRIDEQLEAMTGFKCSPPSI